MATNDQNILWNSIYLKQQLITDTHLREFTQHVRVPEQLMRAMAAEAEAAREARAKVIAAEGEHKASRALRHAAETINDCPSALQVNRRLIQKRTKVFLKFILLYCHFIFLEIHQTYIFFSFCKK